MKKIWYTDGSSKGNPGPGGWGAIEFNEETKEIDNYISIVSEEDTTNNRMELSAILFVCEQAADDPDNEYIIYSDSAYCVNIVNKWMQGWAEKGWCKKVIYKENKVPKIIYYENLDLVKRIYTLFQIPFFNVTVLKTNGHKGILGNELADRLATDDLNSFYKLIEQQNEWTLKERKENNNG